MRTSSSYISNFIALRDSGRLNVTHATCPRTSNSTSCVPTSVTLTPRSLRHLERPAGPILRAIGTRRNVDATRDARYRSGIDRLFCSLHGATRGPFALMGRVGLDVVLDLDEHDATERDDILDVPRKVLCRMVADGKLGV